MESKWTTKKQKMIIGIGLFAIASAITTIAPAAMIEQNAKANRTTLIYRFSQYAEDTCGAMAPPKFKVVFVEHGKIVGTESGFKLDKGHCKGKYIKGIGFKYTPNRGFRGLDKAKVILTMPAFSDDTGAMTETLNFRIHVK